MLCVLVPLSSGESGLLLMYHEGQLLTVLDFILGERSASGIALVRIPQDNKEQMLLADRRHKVNALLWRRATCVFGRNYPGTPRSLRDWNISNVQRQGLRNISQLQFISLLFYSSFTIFFKVILILALPLSLGH